MKNSFKICVIVVLIIQFLGLGFMTYEFMSLAKANTQLFGDVDRLKIEVNQMSKGHSAIDDKHLSMSERINISTVLCSDIIFNDEVAVQFGRMSINTNDVFMDIKPREGSKKTIIGNAEGRMADKEIKPVLEDIITAFNKTYEGWQYDSKSLPQRSELTIHISTYGNDIAVFKNGNLEISRK